MLPPPDGGNPLGAPRGVDLAPSGVETLREVFVGGFGDFRALLSAAPLSRRLAGWCVMAFVRIPPLRPLAEAFLVHYGKLAWRRRAR